MITPARRPLYALLFVTALVGAGCLGGGSAATRFYVLAPGEIPAVPVAGATSVGVGPVGVPGYLDRPQIVTRPAADKIDLGEFDQWGEPLRDGISRVLAEDLARQMPSARISIFPWRSLESVRYQVIVDVTRLDGPAGGDLALEARWRILDAAGKEVAVKTTRLAEPTGGAGYSATVSAMSRVLAALSREIAQALAALPK
ncbi:MAG TPA: PqiC family protein [Methylomirabilota bacterium]|nr:PqiC family protein [Methylomirabilota bacterium]